MKNYGIKEIEGFAGYSVTTDGEVISTKGKEPLILSPNTTRRGYLMVGLYQNRKSTKKLVHRLVAETFLGKPAGKVVNHINMNQKDNRLSNLEWVTQKENLNKAQSKMKRKNRHGRLWGGVSNGSSNGMSKLTEKEVLEIRKLYKTGKYTHRELSKSFGVSKTNIGDIVRGKIWKHI